MPRQSPHRQRGERVERRVGDWLTRQGLTPLGSNWQCRLGEVDLIMQHDGTLVFIEVRYRRRNDFGSALASVDRRKQRRIVAAARHWLAHHEQWQHSPCRFDVVALQQGPDGSVAPVWIQNAFYGESE